MFLELSSIMKARQEVYGCFEMSRTLQAAKDERHYLLSCLRVFIIVCSWQPHDWLDSWRNFWDLKLENEGGNCFSFKLPSMGEWSHSCCYVGNCQYLLFLSTSLFGYFKRESSSLFFVGFIVAVEEIYSSFACDFGDMWAYNVCCLLFFLLYDS